MALYGEWRLKQAAGSDTHGPDASVTSVRVLRELPSQGTVRARKAANQHNTKLEENDLCAFPSLVGESEAFRLKRLLAYRKCWTSVKQDVEKELSSSHTEVFEAVCRHVREEHERVVASGEGVESRSTLRRAQLPMGLMFAGGVNSADHTETYAELGRQLEERGSRVARVLPSLLQKDCGPEEPLRAILRQFSGRSEAHGNDMAALLSWRLHAIENTPDASSAPLVVILEDAESVDPRCLGTLVVLLSDAAAELPVVLLAGMSTSVSALQTMLPAEAVARLRFRVFRLPSALQRFETIVRTVLLGGKHPLLLHSSVCSAIDNYFQCHDFTSTSIMRSLQVVLMVHFATEPLSMLMAAACGGSTELERAVDEVTSGAPQLLAYGRVELCPNIPREAADNDIAEGILKALLEVQSAHRGWAVVLRWLSHAASVLSSHDVSAFQHGFGIKDLFRVGSFTSYYAPGGKGSSVVVQMVDELSTMAAEQVREVLPLWISAADEVVGGRESLGQLLTEVEELLHYDETETGAGENKGDAMLSPVAESEPKTPGTRVAAQVEVVEPESATKTPTGQQGNTRVRQTARGSNRKSLLAEAARRSSTGSQQQAPGTPGSDATAASAKERPRKPRLASRVANLLLLAVGRFLSASPHTLPGARVFLCSGRQATQVLMAAPRHTVHSALSEPSDYLTNALAEASESVALDMEHDTCLAYDISLQFGESINVMDWFSTFASRVQSSAGALPPALTNPGLDEKEAGEKKGGAAARRVSKSNKRKAPPPSSRSAADKEQILDVAARFTQATSEMQLMGYIKPARRARQEAAQRLIFPNAIE